MATCRDLGPIASAVKAQLCNGCVTSCFLGLLLHWQAMDSSPRVTQPTSTLQVPVIPLFYDSDDSRLTPEEAWDERLTRNVDGGRPDGR
jgi:hypothetical protein